MIAKDANMYLKHLIKLVALVPTLLLMNFSSISQIETGSFETAADIYEIAREHYSNEEYEKAFDKFSKVNYNDTAYFESRKFAMQCASSMDKYDTVATIALDLLAETKYNPYREAITNSLGHAYLQLEEYEKAEDVLIAGIEEFPRNYLLHFNLASVLIELEEYDAAVEELQLSIRFNPKYYASHSKLASLCARSGDITKAALSYNMAIFLSASEDVSSYLIVQLEDVYNSEVEDEIDPINYFEEEEFEDLDLMLKNKIAENEKYKVKSKIKFNFIRHNQLLFETMEYDEDSHGFWNQNYIEFFKNIYDTKNFEYFSYYQCLNLETDKVKAVINKYENKLVTFIKWAYNDYSEIMNNRMIWNGDDYVANTLIHYGSYGFNEEYKSVDGVKEGEYFSYSNQGIVKNLGQFSNDGEVDGVWKYYDEYGILETSKTFDEGELSGTWMNYYNNGARRKEFTVTSNAIDGDIIKYYAMDIVYSKIAYDLVGNKSGEALYYHENGQVSHEVNYYQDKIDGELKEYYHNGELKRTTTFKEGVEGGEYRTYHINGAPNIEGEVKEDERVGHWKFMHDNGVVRTEGDYDGGYKVGVWKEYRADGSLDEETDYGSTGKKQGINREYDEDGDLKLELFYKGSEIVKYITYNKEGEVVSEEEKKNRKLQFVDYHRNGEKRVEGEYFKGEATGVWKFYNIHGQLTSENLYNEDASLNGESKWYFDNGTLETVKNYKNGVADGYFVDYYRSGKIFKHGWLVEGDLVGVWEYFYRDGTLRRTEFYLEGERHGDVEYYDEKGVLTEVSHFFYGTLIEIETYDTTGVSLKKYPIINGAAKNEYLDLNGNKKTYREYVGGFLTGKQRAYFGNGQLKSEGDYSFGNEVGEWKWYFRTGEKQTDGAYSFGKRSGEWVWYYKDGTVKKRSMYDDGDINGTSINYYEDGGIEVEYNYKNGKRHGISTYYDQTGIVQLIRYHNYGILIGYSYIGKDGKEIELIEFDGKDGKIEAFFSSGKKSYECSYVDGYTEGKAIYYHANGQVSESRSYKDDKLDGELVEYYPNGQIKVESNYIEGQLVGVYTKYFSNGKIDFNLNYRLGDKYGWSESFDKTGKSLEKIYYYNGREIK